MKNLLLIILSLVLTQQTIAQEEQQSFSLQEAIDFALKNNRTAKNASRDIDVAVKQKWETIAMGLPQINSSIDYQNFLEQQVQFIPAQAFNPNASADEVNPVVFGVNQKVNASATLSQLIFDGTYLVGLQSAKVYLEISKNAKAKTDLEVRKAVINAYGNVLMAEESIKIINKNIETLRQNLNETERIFENGLTEQESVEQLQITLSSIESNLKNTERLKDLAYDMLNITLGLDIDEPILLSENLETLSIKNVDLKFLNSEFSIENTIDFKISKNNEKAKSLLVKLEKSRSLPSISTFLSGGYVLADNDFVFLDKGEKYFGYGLFGASIKLPVFSSGRSGARIQRAKINLEKAQDDLTETEQRLKVQITNAQSEYKFAMEELNNKRQNLNLATRIEQKNQTKFFEGLSSSFELRQAQTQLYSSQQEYLNAMLNVINKKAALETVLNTIN